MRRAALLNPIRTAILALGMCGSLAVGSVGLAGHAEAGEPHDATAAGARRIKASPTRPDVAPVEIQIKDLMNQLAVKQVEEMRIKDGIGHAGESSSKPLDKTAESQQQLLDATKLFD